MIILILIIIWLSIALWATRTLCYYDCKHGCSVLTPVNDSDSVECAIGIVILFLFTFSPLSLIIVPLAIYAKFVEGDWVIPNILGWGAKKFVRFTEWIFIPKEFRT